MSDQSRAVIIGSGPNGLTAAARLAAAGWAVDVYERNDRPGGAATSTDDIFPGHIVDLGAAGHPFGVASPAFRALNLEGHGLRWKHAPYELAHPLDHGEPALLSRSLDDTAERLGEDAKNWTHLHAPVVNHIDEHLENFLVPILRWPAHPVRMAQFGLPGILPAATLGKTLFQTEKARALLAGSAVHAITSPARVFTGAFGMLFGGLGMTRGWPVAEGGTQAIVDALTSVITSNGGTIHTNAEVTDLRELPRADATILNLTPRQILDLRGLNLSRAQQRPLRRWRYGTATWKLDFQLAEPVPWKDPRVGQAATVHLGGATSDIARAEDEAARGQMPDTPFVMACQQYVADPSRGLTLWTYAHVPHGFTESRPGQVAEAIIQQIERFAPGFRDVIVDKHEASPAELQAWNPNLIGGDIAGGAMTGLQTLMRPGIALHPHRLAPGVYLASASTPPGAGVHGMPGWHAAGEALR